MNCSSTRYRRSAQWSSKTGLRISSTVGFRVPAAGLEGLGHLVEQQAAAGALGRHRGDPAVADERPQLIRRVGEEAVSVLVHRRASMTRGAADLASEISPGGTVSRVARYDDDLRFAHVLADDADDITTRRFRALDLRVETKPDLTPVSDADQAAEESLRNVLRRSRPRDAVLGEETGRSGLGAALLGHRPDRRDQELRARRPGLGHADRADGRPGRGGRAWCPRPPSAAAGGPPLGGGAWTGRSLTKASPCRVSGVTKLGDASLSYSSLGGWAERGLLDNFLGLTRSVWRTRAYGDFWSHMLVAEGACDISAEPEVIAVGPGRAADHRHRGRRPVHLARGRGHARTAAAWCAPTATCTTRCWPGCARPSKSGACPPG